MMKHGKRILSLLLVMIMLVSLLPMQVLADEEQNHESVSNDATSNQTETSTTPSDTAKDAAERMNAILELYGITADMTDSEIKQAINAQPWAVNKPTIQEIEQLDKIVEETSEVDDAYLWEHVDLETYYRFRSIFKPMYAAVKASSGTFTPVTGVTVAVSGATNVTNSSGTITTTAKGSGGLFGLGASAKTATINITNDSKAKAKISFHWTSTSAYNLTIDGTKYTGSTSGTFEKVMDAGAKITITLTTDKNSTENKVVMKSFALEAVKESSAVTFQYDENFGSITVAGNATNAGAALDIPMAGAEVKATAKNGATFVAWIDANTHAILSKAATYKLEPADDMTVKAVFTKNACFQVNGNALYEDLDAALTAAASASNKVVILANNGILPAGNYTIPIGVTLLIPYDDANTLCTTAPTTSETAYNTSNTPKVYRQMTMAEGANIIINGALSLSALTTASGGKSAPVGNCSFIQMENGSSITVNNGGNLYAWGYIQGAGAVTVEKGGIVYECFQVMDWRGGDNTSGMVGNKQRVFPMSQYYIQNIEVPMTLKAGAIEKGYMSVAVSLVGIQGSTVPFIGSDGMFQITSGYIVKDYDENTGRLLIDTYGNLSVQSLSLSMKLGILGSSTIKSQDYVLPINGNMTITMHSGSVTMTQDIALQPGARLIIGEGATCTLGSGNKIYVYDYDQWTTEVAADAVEEGPSFCGTGDATHVNLLYPASATNVAGRDQDAYVEVNGTADLSKGTVYTTASGAYIGGTGTIIMGAPGTESITYQVKNTGSDNKTDKWVSIPITSAKLTNADGSVVETANIKGLVTYKSVNGVWTCQHDHKATSKDATCTEAGYTTYTCACGDTYTNDEVAALGHTEVVDAAVAPTCTETGLTEGKHCSVCNTVLVAQEEVAAKGHTAGAEATCTTAQTCTDCGEVLNAAKGHTAGEEATCTTAQICTVCGAELKAALGHKWEWKTDKDATVLESGIKHEECSVCGEKQNEGTVIEILACPHTGTMIGTEAKAETCTEAGNSAYWYCSACQNYYSDAEGQHEIEKDSWIIVAFGHTAGEEATCTTAQICTVCGAELKAALGHTAGAEATCTTAKTCTVCGEVLVAALGHKWEWVTDKAATVLESGIKHEECSVCHVKQNENTEIPVLTCPHTNTMVGTEATAVTCTENGNSAYWYCEACHKYYSDAEGQHEIEKDSWIIVATGHTAGAEATCTTAQTCTVCDAVLVAAKGHTEVIDTAVAPTCTATGLTEGKHCFDCGEVLVAQEVVAALGHTEVVDAAVDATCTKIGLTEGKHCSVCNTVLVAQEQIAALGHQYIENDEHVFTCSVCGATIVEEITDIIGGVQDDSSDEEIAEAVDKIQNMDTEVLESIMKNESTGSNVVEIIEKLENFVDTIVKVEITENAGYAPTQNVVIVGAKLNATEGATVVTLQIAAPKAENNLQIPAGIYNAAGAIKFSMTLENVVNAETLEVPVQIKLPIPATLNADNLVILHFNADGSIKETIIPTIVEIEGQKYAAFVVTGFSDFAITENHVHQLQEMAAVAATCQKEGTIAHWNCSGCGMNFADRDGEVELTTVKIPVDPTNHAFATEGITTAATCKADGKTVYACKNEGCTEAKVDVLPKDPDAHVWDEGKPYGNHSCNSSSYMDYKCTLCGVEKRELVREKHFRVPIGEEIPATCTQDGLTSGWKCEKCHEFWIPQEVIPALGHEWNNGYPCQSAGAYCTRVGCDLHFDTKQEHLVVIDSAVAATCISTGLTEGSHCGYCGKVLVAQNEIPASGHELMIADMEIPARCGVVGHKEGARYCIHCDYDEDPIPALEHTWMHRDAKKATYTVVGWNAHDYCILCNAVKTLEEYKEHSCEFCGDNPEGYVEIPKLEVKANATINEFLTNLEYLEQMAEVYALQNPGVDPLALVLNYMRTGVANYTTGSWAIMAGPEDKDFLKFVQEMEDTINNDPDLSAQGIWINVSGLKKLNTFPNNYGELNIYKNNGSKAPMFSGHFFGTMDMTYHNKGSQNHADVGGWMGDLTDLLSTSDEFGVPANLTFEEKVEYIRKHYLFKDNVAGSAGAFGSSDFYADLDAYYFMNELITNGYETGDLVKLMREYYQEGLTLKQRVAYLMNNRLDGLSTRKDLRNAVYNAYTSNKLIATLEGTRDFNAKGDELTELRKAICYAFADEICRQAGDYVEDLSNPRFEVFDSETTILAPGVSQQISYATNADGKQIVFYIATADVTRDDVGVWVNYYDRTPGTPENPVWKNNSVISSAQNAQNRYGDPNSPDYIENFNVIASTNAGGYDMSDVATPGGLMVMDGIEWHPQSGTAGFFAILSDGTAYMGTHSEYKTMMAAGLIKEAIGGFGEFVVKDGKVTGSATYSDAPRTAVGITATGRVVLMCIDGRQAPFSSGASLQDIGYIMKEAGCVVAINLDGGGSTTFVARQPGSDELTIMNRPSDGYPRNVSTNLLIYSTAPSSTTFDHAVVDSKYDYATIGTPVQMTATGVSPSGSAVEIPAGAYWMVANEDMASITADGVFVGKRLGEVNVYLMLGDQNIGTKRMTIANPDQLYFEKAKVDVIYGSTVTLPLLGRIEGKPIAINPNDVVFKLSDAKAGKMVGFTFTAYETTTKTLTITASIGENISASINVMLYKQGENSFDFENATGGDRTLAWDRDVSNSKVEDGNIYNVINPSKEMVTSYIFAMDMTTIPIPERLSELTYMLPGGTLEGANAWSFLLSLAQRISDMSWVKATIKFDERFVVDYSELTILNDYFEMKDLAFDEATNTLTVTMGWIKQSQVIDEATANPLCLIKGIKLTPKDGVWENTTKINAVISGSIGYRIYMRASGLYGFAQKPESQAIFGLYPYRDGTDAGAYFEDTYAEITDTFTLVNVLKEGWVNEDGGFAYYVNGKRLYGVQKINGFYYDFGDKGVNVGQTKFTGLFFDETAKAYRYAYIGVLTSGWQSINNEWYYFLPSTMAAAQGALTVNHVPYEFEENGKLVSGVWMNVFTGYRYYYGPDYVRRGWYKIGDDMYYFKDAYAVTGDQYITTMESTGMKRWYHFDENGVSQGRLTGIVDDNGTLYYVENGKATDKGLFKLGDDHYFTDYRGALIVNQRYYAWKVDASSELPKGHYDFGPDGKILGAEIDEETGGVSGIVEKDGKLYYYENGKPADKGMFAYKGAYYFTLYNGELVVNQKYYVWKHDVTSPFTSNGHYEFGPDGKLMDGIINKDGILYYYELGKPADRGLFVLDGDYYFTLYNGQLVVDQIYYVWKHDSTSNLTNGNYEFGKDGKMLQGIVDKDGVLVYYENGRAVAKGLFVYTDGYHYYADANGVLIVGQSYYAWQVDNSSLLAQGKYEFGTDGRVVGSCVTGEIVNKNGILYYYEAGKPADKGLFLFNGNYYCTLYTGELVVDQKYYVWNHDITSTLPNGHYEFDAEGKMLQGIVEKDGKLFYYENGKTVDRGLFLYNGDYYFTLYNGELVVSQKYYVWKHDDTSTLTNGHYEFDAEGKMLQGIVEKDGKLFYYENGKTVDRGLFSYNGDYYFTLYTGELVVDQQYYVWKHDITSDFANANYLFDEMGRMIGSSKTGEIVNIDGVLYYYEMGKAVDKGLFYLDGYYYFTRYNGQLVVNQDYYVWKDNPYLMVKTYTFNELGQIVG